MGTIWVREFTGGLDARRMPETTPGGALIRAVDGHINRGGEFDKRAAFVKAYDLPIDTVNMAAGVNGLTVFGSGPPPALPAGVSYMRLQAPSGNLVKVLSTTRFSGLLYVVALFDNGKRYHFYNGVIVDDWFDERPRATLTIGAGTVVPGAQAVGSFKMMTYNASSSENDNISSIMVGGKELLIGGGFTYTPSANSQSAIFTTLVTSINKKSAESGYSATGDFATKVITITATAGGTAANGKTISVTNIAASGTTFGTYVAMAGGTETQPSVDTLTIGGTAIIGAPVVWSGDPSALASALAIAINAYADPAVYRAEALGPVVTLEAVDLTDLTQIGKIISYTTTSLVVTPASAATSLQAGGAVYTPGSYVATIGSKVYSVSGPNLHFSGIKEPTKWQPNAAIGAGFIDMSSEAFGSEELQAVVKYQSNIAVFAKETVQVWFADPDPMLNRQVQVLSNTGTVSGRSVVQFSDADIFYLDESGVRSLRARDSSNAAATSDIGVPIDPLVIDKLKTIPIEDRPNIMSVIEPRDGRYWLVLGDEIYVFSYFPGSKVSAWSLYTPTIRTGEDVTTLPVDDIVVYRRRVYIRSGDAIYVYGGLGEEIEYDDTQPEVWLPYLDAGAPTKAKSFTGIDVACKGLWEVSMAMQPNDLEAVDVIARIDMTTYNGETNPAIGSSTHFGLRFRGIGEGAHRLASAVIHFEDEIDAD